MRLTADSHNARQTDRILLTAYLIAEDGPVCLGESYRLTATVSRIGDPGEPMNSDEGYVLCGTPMVAMLPAYPVVLAVSLLDVTDSLKRFVVLKKGEVVRHELDIEHRFRRGEVESAWDTTSETMTPWPIGRYEITVQLRDDWTTAFLPAPLFWTPYSHSVEDKVIIEVLDASVSPVESGGAVTPST